MRVDKFLKISRIIKRRTIAKDVCDADRILINGKLSKPSAKVNVGDVLDINFGNSNFKIEVLEIKEHVRKDEAEKLYRIIN